MSRSLNLDSAIDQACQQAMSTTPQKSSSSVEPELAMVFLSSAYADQFEQVGLSRIIPVQPKKLLPLLASN